jgi:alanine dehydrogenase
MHKEPGEIRDFLPDFVAFLDHHGAERIVVEEGYGEGIGFSPGQYQRASPVLEFGSYEDCLGQDLCVVVRCPDEDVLPKIRRGGMLISMLHFATSPDRVRLLVSLGIRALSLDSIVDERGRRIVENITAVGWNGMEATFREFMHLRSDFDSPARGPLRITILGSGAVAGAAASAATRYGDRDLHARLVALGVPGVEVTLIDHDLTRSESYMRSRLEASDVLVDATRRPDPTKTVVPNEWLAWLPEDALILDLTADPYNFTVTPPIVKSVEGIPHGNLDHYVFDVDDPAYETLAMTMDVRNRRKALSCYSWPGVHPRDCMELYGAQMEPIMELVLAGRGRSWSMTSDSHLERELARAEVRTWLRMANASR